VIDAAGALGQVQAAIVRELDSLLGAFGK